MLTAPNADEALDVLETTPVDVAVFDVKMPGLDGVTLFEITKRRWPSLPVIILTGHASIQDAFQTSRQGVFEYLRKPCEPEKLAEVATAAVAAARGEGEGTAPAEPEAPIRVLFVDDEEEFLAAHQPLLHRRGFDVETATTGRRALELLDSGLLEVAVVDLRMPGMDGLELLRAVKKRHPTVEVIILTGLPSLSSAMKGVREGAFDFIAKPIEIAVLKERILAAWRHRRSVLEEQRKRAVRRIVRDRPD